MGTTGTGTTDYDSCMYYCITLALVGTAVACAVCVTTQNPLACFLCGAILTNIHDLCSSLCSSLWDEGGVYSVAVYASINDVMFIDQAIVQQELYDLDTGDLLFEGTQELH